MDNREHAERENQESQTNVATPAPPAVTRPNLDPEQVHSVEVHNRSNPNPERTEKWFRKPDWCMVFLTALLSVVGIITVWIFHRQLSEMTAQTEILRYQAKQAASDASD